MVHECLTIKYINKTLSLALLRRILNKNGKNGGFRFIEEYVDVHNEHKCLMSNSFNHKKSAFNTRNILKLSL